METTVKDKIVRKTVREKDRVGVWGMVGVVFGGKRVQVGWLTEKKNEEKNVYHPVHMIVTLDGKSRVKACTHTPL